MEREQNINDSLKFEQIEIGMKIVDDEGTEGIITGWDDAHNVDVIYTKGQNNPEDSLIYDGGQGTYCLDHTCKYFDKLYLKN